MGGGLDPLDHSPYLPLAPVRDMVHTRPARPQSDNHQLCIQTCTPRHASDAGRVCKNQFNLNLFDFHTSKKEVLYFAWGHL